MSGMTEHPDLLLSAYLDDALAAGEADAVRVHLDGCARCRGRLAELQATSRLIAALPQLEPRRSLVPHAGHAPVWLRPVRLLGAIGSGVFVFLFLTSAVINSGSSLGGGTTTAERLAEQGKFGAAANALASDAAKGVAQSTAGPAAPAAAPSAQSQNFDTSRNATAASATPVARVDAASAPAATRESARPSGFGPPPALFLGIAALCALIAFVAHRRLRRA